MPWLSKQVWTKLARGDARQLSVFIAQCGLIGILAGLAAVAFDLLVDFVTENLIARVAHLHGAPDVPSWPEGTDWLILALPTLGGLVCGLILFRWAPETQGSGAGPVIHAYHHEGGRIRKRVPVVKAAASALVLGTGGSAGVEGPIGQISAGIGTMVANLLRLPPERRRVLMMAGFAAGIGAIFHAPMASAFFAAEVLYHQMDIEHDVLVPSIIASVVAHAVFGAVTGWGSPFEASNVTFNSGLELLPYTVLAILLAPLGALFVRAYGAVKEGLRESATIPHWLRPAIGGFGVGLVGLLVPQAMGTSQGVLQVALAGEVSIGVLLLVAGAKLVATALTVGSGQSGGLFAPTLVIGGTFGGAVGFAAAELFPALEVSPASFVVVGMAGFFAGVANAPLSTVIMVSELVGSYELVVPTLWVCTLAWLLSRRVVVFSEQVPTRFDAPSGLADMMGGVLERLTVRDAMRVNAPAPATVRPGTPLRELVEIFAHTNQSVFPILDEEQHLLGVVDGRQLRAAIGAPSIDALLIANDFQAPALYVHAGADLRHAIEVMTRSGFDELLVVAESDGNRLEGLLSRRQIVATYHHTMLHLQLGQADGSPVFFDGDAPCADDAEDLYATVRRGGVLHDVEGATPAAVFEDMLAKADLPPGADPAHILDLLLKREALSPTAVGGGVAIPHPHAHDLGAMIAPTIIIGLPRDPVPWDAPDGAPVHTVCILLSASGDAHLRLLGELVRALVDPGLHGLLHARAPGDDILARLHEMVFPDRRDDRTSP